MRAGCMMSLRFLRLVERGVGGGVGFGGWFSGTYLVSGAFFLRSHPSVRESQELCREVS